MCNKNKVRQRPHAPNAKIAIKTEFPKKFDIICENVHKSCLKRSHKPTHANAQTNFSPKRFQNAKIGLASLSVKVKRSAFTSKKWTDIKHTKPRCLSIFYYETLTLISARSKKHQKSVSEKNWFFKAQQRTMLNLFKFIYHVTFNYQQQVFSSMPSQHHGWSQHSVQHRKQCLRRRKAQSKRIL